MTVSEKSLYPAFFVFSVFLTKHVSFAAASVGRDAGRNPDGTVDAGSTRAHPRGAGGHGRDDPDYTPGGGSTDATGGGGSRGLRRTDHRTADRTADRAADRTADRTTDSLPGGAQ